MAIFGAILKAKRGAAVFGGPDFISQVFGAV
jgi:hypothetical protein